MQEQLSNLKKLVIIRENIWNCNQATDASTALYYHTCTFVIVWGVLHNYSVCRGKNFIAFMNLEMTGIIGAKSTCCINMPCALHRAKMHSLQCARLIQPL